MLTLFLLKRAILRRFKAGIYSGDEHDEAMENFLLAVDKVNDELTKLVARCIRVKLDSFIIDN